MAKDYDQEITVYIWQNAPLLKAASSGHFGHASLAIKGFPVVSGKKWPEISEHMSWWPGEPNEDYGEDKKLELSDKVREKLEKGEYKPRKGQRYNEARGEWEQSATDKVRLPGLGATGCYFGLGLLQLHLWWKHWQTGNEYKLVSKSKNCAGAAAIGLRAAGASAFVAPPKAVVVMEPNQILKWAKAVLDEIAVLNAATEEIDVILQKRIKSGIRFFCPDPPDLTTAEAWKAESGKLKEGAEILKLLGKYHSYNWKSDFKKEPDTDDFSKKMAALIGIVKIIAKVTQKNQSIPAPLEPLAYQIIRFFKRETTPGF